MGDKKTPNDDQDKKSNVITFNAQSRVQNKAPSEDLMQAASPDKSLKEVGEEEFYESTGLPADHRIWRAHLTGYQNYLLNTGLQDELRHGYYQANCMFPAKILAKHGGGFMDDEEHLHADVFIAALTWQSVRDNQDLAKNDELFSNQALDIVYDMIEYDARRKPFSAMCQGAQAAMIANQIVATMQHTGDMENWAFQVYKGKKTVEDVEESKAFYQRMITEKFSGDTVLEEILDEQLERLRTCLRDETLRVPKSQKKHVFKLIPGGKKR